MKMFNRRNKRVASLQCATDGCTREASGRDTSHRPACAMHMSVGNASGIAFKLLTTPTELPPAGTTFRGLVHPGSKRFNSNKAVTKQVADTYETNVDEKLEQSRQSSQNFIFNSSLGGIVDPSSSNFVFNSSLVPGPECPQNCDEQGMIYDACPHCEGTGCTGCNHTGEVRLVCTHEPVQEPF